MRFHDFSQLFRPRKFLLKRSKMEIRFKIQIVTFDVYTTFVFLVLTFVFDSRPAQGARYVLARKFKMSQFEFYEKRKDYNFERKNRKKSSNEQMRQSTLLKPINAFEWLSDYTASETDFKQQKKNSNF